MCGVILAPFVLGTTAMAACHDANGQLNPHHKRHHKKADTTVPANGASTMPADATGFTANG